MATARIPLVVALSSLLLLLSVLLADGATAPIVRTRVCSKLHRVRAGDTCASAAARYGVDEAAIRAMNHYDETRCAHLDAGDMLCVAP